MFKTLRFTVLINAIVAFLCLARISVKVPTTVS